MAISEDQRAMLQLLLDGGQGYDDIASLLGIGRDEVRTRARDALREIGGADPDAQVGLTDYLLGHADPIGRADAARHLQSSPEANELARKISAQLRLLAPNASLPDIPVTSGRAARPPTPPTAPPGVPAPSGSAGGGTPSTPGGSGEAAGRLPGLSGVGERFRGLSPRQGKVAVALGAGALLVIAVVLVVAGVFDSGDDGGGEQQAATSGDEGLTIVPLEPVGDSGGSGQAVFARAGDQPVLQINLTGLAPTSKDENYIVWLYASDQIAFPLARDRVGEDGNLTGAAPIPQQLIGVLSQFQFVDVSLASNKDTRDAIQQATQQQSLPAYAGQSVLRGEIPRGANASAGGDTGTAQGAPTGPTPTAPSSPGQ